MEWISTVKASVQYIEDNLLSVEGINEVAKSAFISPSYLQQGFQIITGFSVTEYIRNRRLYQAAIDLIRTDDKITDIAFKYGYDTPASFTKAFTRFHDANPSEIRKQEKTPKSFLPIKVSLVIQGGDNLEVEIVEREPFKVIGYKDTYTMDNCHLIAERWREFNNRYSHILSGLQKPENDIERAIFDNKMNSCGITEYPTDKPYNYIFGGPYQGGNVPEGMVIYEIPGGTWAVFSCIGKLPDAMEDLMPQIWDHWVKTNTEYVVDGKCEFEMYYDGDYYNDPNYLCTKWIPIRKIK